MSSKDRKKFGFFIIKKSDFYLWPNILTLSRLITIPLIATFIYLDWNWVATILFSLSGLSDYFDGWVARTYHYESKLGMLLDPLADKLIIVSTMIMLLWMGRLDMHFFNWNLDLVPPFLVIVTVGREIGITGLRAIASTAGIDIPADQGGKIKTWIQFFSIVFLLMHKHPWVVIGQVGLMISVVAALWSGMRYTWRFIRKLPA